ncbi:hypothetical protein MHU86_17818 [Fragilaria crotonensis]|nr:hypothetical protein MHU86_17818 [Fragilaria crotonensis]
MKPDDGDSNQKESTAVFNLKSVEGALNDIADNRKAIVYLPEELAAMREVKKRLQDEDKLTYVNPRFLAYLVVVCKNRVDEAADKFRRYLKAIAACGMTNVESDEDLWADPSVEQFLRDYYVPCGRDFDNRQVLWIRSHKAILESEEKTSIRAGILYVIAIHADHLSLREGITFVIDTSNRGTFKQVGNESKLQKINQSMPFRPQAIYIAGASPAMRIVINGLIKIASFFTKQKILQRIRFVTLEEAMASVPKESGPRYLGGGSGGIDDVIEWTKRRYFEMPIPDLEDNSS